MITRILKGQWPVNNTLNVATLRKIVRELDRHDIPPQTTIEVYAPDGKDLTVGGFRFQKDEGTPPMGGPVDELHILVPKPEEGGGGHTPGIGWMCTGCDWKFSYDVAESRAREVWLSDSRHEVTK